VAVLIKHIAGEVPPFRFEIRVGVMISRELILPTWLRRFPVSTEAAERER
jgi:hypothetical protein